MSNTRLTMKIANCFEFAVQNKAWCLYQHCLGHFGKKRLKSHFSINPAHCSCLVAVGAWIVEYRWQSTFDDSCFPTTWLFVSIYRRASLCCKPQFWIKLRSAYSFHPLMFISIYLCFLRLGDFTLIPNHFEAILGSSTV